jgi:hypothetical protein
MQETTQGQMVSLKRSESVPLTDPEGIDVNLNRAQMATDTQNHADEVLINDGHCPHCLHHRYVSVIGLIAFICSMVCVSYFQPCPMYMLCMIRLGKLYLTQN